MYKRDIKASEMEIYTFITIRSNNCLYIHEMTKNFDFSMIRNEINHIIKNEKFSKYIESLLFSQKLKIERELKELSDKEFNDKYKANKDISRCYEIEI